MKLIHTADWHLGASLDSVPAEARERVAQLRLEACRQAVGAAAREGTDALLIAGDLFHHPLPERQLAADTFDLLAQAPCPVLIVPGNHDHLCPGSPYLTLARPENVHVFATAQLSPYRLAEGVIWGAAFLEQSAAIPLTAPCQPEDINVALVHGDRQGQSGYNPVSREDLAASPFDYVALGHNHQPEAGESWAVPGCLCPAGWDEPGEHGYYVTQVEKSRVKSVFLAAGGPRFERLSVDAAQENWERQLPPAAGRTLLELTLTGLQGSPEARALERALGETYLHAQVWDKRRAPLDPLRHREEDSLYGEVTRLLLESRAQAAPEEQTLYDRALEIVLEALENS